MDGGLQVKPLKIAVVLDKLEAHYGPQEPCWPG